MLLIAKRHQFCRTIWLHMHLTMDSAAGQRGGGVGRRAKIRKSSIPSVLYCSIIPSCRPQTFKCFQHFSTPDFKDLDFQGIPKRFKYIQHFSKLFMYFLKCQILSKTFKDFLCIRLSNTLIYSKTFRNFRINSETLQILSQTLASTFIDFQRLSSLAKHPPEHHPRPGL